jgi:Fe-S cluster assembly iron-binding protein IscA
MTTEKLYQQKTLPEQVWQNIEDFAISLDAFGITKDDSNKKTKVRKHIKKLYKISKKLNFLLRLQIEQATGITGFDYKICFYDSWSYSDYAGDISRLDVYLTVSGSANHENQQAYTEGLEVEDDWQDRKEVEQDFLEICKFCKLMSSKHLQITDFCFDLTLRSSGSIFK